MKVADKERGANVRRNLRRWRKPLFIMMAVWFLLVLVVCVSAISYAHAQHFSQQRTQMLAEGCGAVLCLPLMVAWLVILMMADRKKSE